MNKCPGCGYSGLDKPAYNGFGNPSFDICDCSVHNNQATTTHSTSFAVLRDRWIAKGMPWHSRAFAAPAGWAPRLQQLRSLTNDTGRSTIAPGAGKSDDTGIQQT